MNATDIDDRGVLFICHQATFTGAPIALLRILDALKRTSSVPFGWLVWVRVPGPLLERFDRSAIPVICSDSGALAVRSWSMRKIWALTKYYVHFTALVVRRRPRIVYSNTAANSLEVIIARSLGARTIVHVHEGEGMIAKLRWQMVLSRPFTTRYVAVSDYVRRALDEALHVDSMVIYNGLSGTTGNTSKDVMRSFGEATLAVIGIVCANKGQLLAVEALARLRASGHRVALKLIGSIDDEDYVGSVQEKARELGVESYVDIVGQRAVEEVYEGVDMVLIPSQEETFSMVALEAMSRGVLVIAANTGGIPEVVQDEKTGLLFTGGSVKDLASRVEAAITHPARMTEITVSARQRVLHAFSLDNTVNAVTRLIVETMGIDKGRRGTP